jgi:cyanate lyase
VYGTTFKALINEEFGDGIMSAIDFRMDLQREADPNGDRVRIEMSGKFLLGFSVEVRLGEAEEVAVDAP